MASFFKLLHSPDVSRRRRRFNPHRFFHQVKFYAIESAATLVLLAWLLKEVRQQLEW